MATNNAVNLQVTNNAVGATIGGGTTVRSITWNGAGNTTLTAQQAIVLTLPNRATDTVVGYGDYSAKGVILVGTGAGAFTALAVGADGTSLQADSAQASGVKWAAASNVVWSEVTGTSQAAAVNSGYITNNVALVTVTLPTTAALGTIIEVSGKGAGGWKVAQNSGQTIHFGNVNTTTGTGGSLASTLQYDTVRLLCTTANTDWVVLSNQGNITVV